MADRPVRDPTTTLKSTPLPQRKFGRFEQTVPIIGLGTGPGGMGMADPDAIRLYHRAIDLGMTYLDTAPGYGSAHKQLAEVLSTRRDEVFIATKTPTADRDEAIRKLEQNLEDLGIEYVDLVFLHSLGGRDVETVLSANGALVGLAEAKRRGLARYIGFTAHHEPAKSLRVIREADIDAVMLAMNFADRYTYDFEGTVLPAARERGVAVMAMKVYGGAPKMEYNQPAPSALAAATEQGHRWADRFDIDFHDLALRYALTLPGVSGAVIGAYTEDEVRFAVECARDLRPLSSREDELLRQHGKRIADKWGEHFGPVNAG